MSHNEQVAATTESRPEILDACCGGRMWWWHKKHPLAAYMDIREAPRGSVGELTGRPEWNPNWSCEPDICGDFRAMPWADESFQMVVFDPPHVTREKQPPEGINGLKYGALHPDTEQEDLRLGFAECWRVLRPGGTLVFKWGAGSVKRVEPHFPATPIVGTRSPRGGQTRWFIFYKPLDAVQKAGVSDAAPGRYVWACSVCRDPNYTREGPATLYLDERYCPTCGKRQPIIVFDTTLSEVAR